jgi:hypothetical protein
VTVDEPSTVTLTLFRGKTALTKTTRKLADGPTGISLTLPAKARRVGSYTLRLTVEGSPLRAERPYRIVTR